MRRGRIRASSAYLCASSAGSALLPARAGTRFGVTLCVTVAGWKKVNKTL
jgi:hypothetical protein